MNKYLSFMAAILIGLSFPSCTKISGEGPVMSETRSVADFKSIRSGMSGDVFIRQDSIFKVEVRGQKNILDVLNTTVSGGELKIDFDHNVSIRNNERVEVYISCPDISGIALSGSGNISTTNNISPAAISVSVSGSGSVNMPSLNTSSLFAKISGSGDISILNGTAPALETEISGSGSMDLLGLQSANATVKITGSGDTKVNVSEQLNVKITGSGDVYYKGRPGVSSSISGSGKVHAM